MAVLELLQEQGRRTELLFSCNNRKLVTLGKRLSSICHSCKTRVIRSLGLLVITLLRHTRVIRVNEFLGIVSALRV